MDSYGLPVLIVAGFAQDAQMFIKVLVNDTLILQVGTSMLHILERKAGVSYADELIANLTE